MSNFQVKSGHNAVCYVFHCSVPIASVVCFVMYLDMHCVKYCIRTDVISFTVPSSPQNFSLSSVAGSPFQLSASWSAPIPKNGIITGYSVYCNTSANQSYPEQVIGSNVPTIISVVNGTTLAVTLTGLNPYTRYSCYVTANTLGQGSPSTILTVQTVQSGTCNIFQVITVVLHNNWIHVGILLLLDCGMCLN